MKKLNIHNKKALENKKTYSMVDHTIGHCPEGREVFNI